MTITILHKKVSPCRLFDFINDHLKLATGYHLHIVKNAYLHTYSTPRMIQHIIRSRFIFYTSLLKFLEYQLTRTYSVFYLRSPMITTHSLIAMELAYERLQVRLRPGNIHPRRETLPVPVSFT